MTAPSSTEAGNVPPRQERKDMLEVIKVWGARLGYLGASATSCFSLHITEKTGRFAGESADHGWIQKCIAEAAMARGINFTFYPVE